MKGSRRSSSTYTESLFLHNVLTCYMSLSVALPVWFALYSVGKILFTGRLSIALAFLILTFFQNLFYVTLLLLWQFSKSVWASFHHKLTQHNFLEVYI